MCISYVYIEINWIRKIGIELKTNYARNHTKKKTFNLWLSNMAAIKQTYTELSDTKLQITTFNQHKSSSI